MAFLKISNVELKGVAACVPPYIDENINYPIPTEDIKKLISSVGIERKRVVDKDVCTSDLCFKATETLLKELNWVKEDIDCLVFITQTPDYIVPATSCILQDRLGLKEECYTLDISLGCSGYVYGMSIIASLMSSGFIKKGLLLVGDTSSKTASKEDKSTWPLFGDAGTATAFEFNPDAEDICFHLATDGSGKDAIIIKDGGYRNMVSEASFVVKEIDGGIKRSDVNLILDGMDVFSFAVSKAPQTINKLCENFDLDKENVDYFVFHQANLFLNETIRRKMRIDKAKVPYSLKNFGNTSSASIPLTMVTEIREQLTTKQLNLIGCGFGVGLSWGSVAFTTRSIVCPELVIY